MNRRPLPFALITALPVLVAGLLHAGTTPPPTPTPEPVVEKPAGPSTASIVRVNSTNQAFNFTRPWVKRPPYTRRGIGVILEGGRVLVTSELVGNQSYVELENPVTFEKSTADVVRVDYEANLALIKPQDDAFLASAIAATLAPTAAVGDTIEILQIEPNGSAARTPGVITTISVANYPADGIGLLTYKLSVPLQFRDNSFTVPAFLDGQLAGILMRYDARSQTAELIPSPVISAFLERAKTEPYQSFPRAGIAFSPTRDPQFRRYLGMNGEKNGVYVASVQHGSAAAKIGVKKGDVLLEVGGFPLDQDGNYENPQFGKIPFGHIIATENLPGGTLPIKILRDGELLDFDLPLEPRDPTAVISESFIMDRQPRYYVLGGIIFQELSRPFLREWGSDWKSEAPQRLVFLDEFQDELPPNRGKIVFLNQVLPADLTLGYEQIGPIVVERINDRPIRRLEDVAEAVKSPIDGFHKIEFDSDPKVIFLDASLVEATADELRQAYDLPALNNL